MSQTKTEELPLPAPSLAEELHTSPYKLVREMARGGMGEVYEIEHRELGRRLVMKVLRSYLSGNADAAARLKAEGRMLTKLIHPNLVEVVDFGRTTSGRPYLVTEMLRGKNLREELRARGPLGVSEAIEIALQTLQGLEKVHQGRLVHRDIKLDNLFYCEPDLSGARRLKILDFGIARIAAEDREAMGGVAPTADGMILGTPNFMSPEQIVSGKVDARTDLYAVGAVLYRLIAGRGPFEGADHIEIMRAHLLNPLAPLSATARQPIPEGLDELVAKAMAKRPDDRFPDAPTMASELRQLDRSVSRMSGQQALRHEVTSATIELRTLDVTGLVDTEDTIRDPAPTATTTTADEETIYRTDVGKRE